MKHRVNIGLSLALLITTLTLVLGTTHWPALAQDPVESSPVPPITVSTVSPNTGMVGQTFDLTVTGANFTADTKVNIVGFGLLTTTFMDATTLKGTVPSSVSAGVYALELQDPVGGTIAIAAYSLNILSPTATLPPTATAEPPIIVNAAEPNMAVYGQEVVLSVIGKNFTPNTTIRILGFGVLQTDFINDSTLKATVPGTIMPGSYVIEISDPVRGFGYLPNYRLTVLGSTATPAPTSEPLPTREPSTPTPGEPSLIVRGFTSDPAVALPGGVVMLSFELVNQGNRAAQGVSASITAGSVFVPANGQSTATVPDIAPRGVQSVVLYVLVPMDATPGPHAVPLTMSFRDFSGQTYSNDASVSLNVADVAEAPQVVLSSYTADPDPVVPGGEVSVTIYVENTGTKNASQVLLRVSDGILLAGGEGDTFPLGDIPAGGMVTRTLPLLVSREAKPGPQAQPVTITFMEEDQAQTLNTSMTVKVDNVRLPQPLLLLSSYNVGDSSFLRPGQQFTLTAQISNLGTADVRDLLVVFGNVEGSGGSGGTGTGTGVSGAIFAPIGTGGTQFVSEIVAAGEPVTLQQDFIVSGGVDSAIYGLPISLIYTDVNGEEVKAIVSASLIVIAPPQLQVVLQSPVPEVVSIGEAISLPFTITNTGKKQVNLVSATVTAEGADIYEGQITLLKALKVDGETQFFATVAPNIEGTVTITVSINYTDDLNNLQSIVQTYETQAFAPPPFEEPPFPEPEVPTPEADEDKGEDRGTVRRFLLGLMGLGS